MTTHSPPRTARSRAIATLIALATALSGVLVVGSATPVAAGDGDGLGRLVKIQSDWEASKHENTTQRVYLDNPVNGAVNIVMEHEGCLSTDFFESDFFYAWADRITKVCEYDAMSQRFYLVPVNPNPRTDSERLDRADNKFYIVSADTHKCFFSRQGGLVGKGNYEASTAVNQMTPRGFVDCANPVITDFYTDSRRVASDVRSAMQFTIINDVREPGGGWPEWSNALALAYRYAATHCAGNSQSCRIQADGQTEWYPPGSPEVLERGTLEDVVVGCGAFDGTQSNASTSNPYHNMTRDPVSVTLATAQTRTHSHSIGTGWKVGGNVQFGYGMTAGNPLGFKVEASFEVNGNETTLDSSTKAVTETRTNTVRPGEYYMMAWTEQRYSLDAHLKMLTDRWGGALAWQMPIGTVYPAATAGKGSFHASDVTSILEKSCLAGAASTNVSPPVVTADPASCSGTPTPVPEPIEAGTTLHVCPGTWKTADGDKNPGVFTFGYQWYLTSGSVDGEHPITGATAPSYTVSNRTLDTKTTFIGVKVIDLGHEMRLETSPALLSSNTPELATRSAGNDLGSTNGVVPDDEPPGGTDLSEITNLVGRVGDATVGEAYEASLVAAAHPDGTPSAGDGMRLVLSDSDLPDGFALSEDGTLTGTAPSAGAYTFTVTDEGPSAVSRSYELTVRNDPATFVANDEVIDARIDAELSVSLVETPGSDSRIELVEGSALPAGLELDPDGTLHGTPTAYGPVTFTVHDASSVSGDPVEFTVDVEDSPITLHDQDEHHLVIGEPYEADLVTDPGSGPMVGTLGAVEDDVVPLRDEHHEILRGMQIDPTTGRLYGTPVNEGSVTLLVGDLSHPETPTKEVKLVVHTEAPATESSRGWVIGLAAAVALLAAAAVAVYVVRRRRPGDGSAAA